METFLRCAFISEKFFLLVVFMFFFLSKIFSQSKVGEQITEQPKHFHDLCEASKNGVKAAKLIAQDSFFSVAKTSIQQVGQDKHEHSITFGRDASGNLTISPMINGDSTNGKINSGWLGAFADIHNHSNDQPPSAGISIIW